MFIFTDANAREKVYELYQVEICSYDLYFKMNHLFVQNVVKSSRIAFSTPIPSLSFLSL